MTPTRSAWASRPPLSCWALLSWLAPLALLPVSAVRAQAPAQPQVPAASTGAAGAAGAAAWQHCTTLANDSTARLACFDQWARQQAGQAPGASANAAVAAPEPAQAPQAPVDTTLPATRIIEVARTEGCRDRQYSDLSRFWELEVGSDCGTFSFRGYRPITVSVVTANNVNQQPSSTAAGHTALAPVPYSRTENRIQLSVRTKIAQGLLTQGHPTQKDSLWFGYSQQSYWQLFSPDISRPFRTTDHEPEVVYVYPTDARLPGGWRWRYSGIGVAHQSNGQSLPLSRSWNRTYLMTGMELGNRFTVNAKVWKRIPESASSDDNPGISDYIGRGELSAFWNYDQDNTFGLTVRHALARPARGSARVEWMQTLGTGLWGSKSNLRFHTQLFSGYGDSLIDFNRRRTVFSLGLSLVDF